MEFDLKAWRGRLGLTQEQAARQLGLTLRGYQKAEGNGPTRTLVLLAELLEATPAPLVIQTIIEPDPSPNLAPGSSGWRERVTNDPFKSPPGHQLQLGPTASRPGERLKKPSKK